MTLELRPRADRRWSQAVLRLNCRTGAARDGFVVVSLGDQARRCVPRACSADRTWCGRAHAVGARIDRGGGSARIWNCDVGSRQSFWAAAEALLRAAGARHRQSVLAWRRHSRPDLAFRHLRGTRRPAWANDATPVVKVNRTMAHEFLSKRSTVPPTVRPRVLRHHADKLVDPLVRLPGTNRWR